MDTHTHTLMAMHNIISLVTRVAHWGLTAFCPRAHLRVDMTLTLLKARKKENKKHNLHSSFYKPATLHLVYWLGWWKFTDVTPAISRLQHQEDVGRVQVSGTSFRGANHWHKKGEGGHGCGRGDHHAPGALEDQGTVTGKKEAGGGVIISRSLTWFDLWKSLHSFLIRLTCGSLACLRHSCPSLSNTDLQHILPARLHCLKGTAAGDMTWYWKRRPRYWKSVGKRSKTKQRCFYFSLRRQKTVTPGGSTGGSWINSPLLRQKWWLSLAVRSPKEIPQIAVWSLATKMVFLTELIIPREEPGEAAAGGRSTHKRRLIAGRQAGGSSCDLRITEGGRWEQIKCWG